MMLRTRRVILDLVAPALALVLLLVAGPLYGQDAELPLQDVVPRSIETDGEGTLVPVPVPSRLALEYHRTGNWLWAFDQVWTIAVLAALLFSGGSARIRTLARRLGGSWYPTVGLYIVLYMLALFVIDLPVHYYQGFVRQHAYGLSNQSIGKWWGDSWKHFGVSATVGLLLGWVPYFLIDRAPRRWWLITSLLSVPFLFAVLLVKPVWVDPLFNQFAPMKNQGLEREILALAERAGIAGGRIYEVNKSVDTKAVNAYVTGLLGSKRIVLWDTLLTKLDEREVLAVMGHEMGHYVLGHVPRSIALSTLITLLGLWWVDRAGRWLIDRFHRRFGFDRLSDVASVPLILLLLHVGALALGPVANLYSRHQEHEADVFALEITQRNRSAALAFAKLQQENLSNPYPSWFYRIWRSTHPSIGERIEFCNAYRPWATGRTMRYSGRFRP